ncbi:MAG: S-layer homology domain-containing protein, partial [Ruminococcaceae bacterium]|nr:S-layer homology domain-containing protein [Oscillospiraceae bacterium]
FNDEDVEEYEDTDISDFSDAETVSDYAVDAIVWAVGAEIINGMDGNIAPTEPATRAQIAAMLERYLDL